MHYLGHHASMVPFGLSALLALFISSGGPAAASTDPPDVAELRARGPAGLEALLARYDQAPPAEQAALADAVDAVAGQRYATVSRLYWYTDLDRAQAAARALRRPILALRMLGDLRVDLSCANSRLFRATLYANAEVAAFLRDHFVLYWSSERAVPVVTIDYGDGRKLVRTTTGNSIHYVLDDRGRVLDALPGLYAPAVFRGELAEAVKLADRVRDLDDAQRRRAIASYHEAGLDAVARDWERLRDAGYVPGYPFLLEDEVRDRVLVRAQAATIGKAAIEVPDLARIGLIRPEDVPNDEAAWAAIGQRMWNIGGPRATDPPPTGRAARRAMIARMSRNGVPAPEADAAHVPPPLVLDARSRALVGRLHDAGSPAADPKLAQVIARLEQHIVADSAINQIRLRPMIRSKLLALLGGSGGADLATLNAWIYDTVFATPRSDAWMGLLPRTEFTGLPGDGVVMP